ncbi:helix-turn-helix domain-containing protein [Streptomyces sp. NPDC007148]|uniref:helix-turn-helix domain-containing protein n=1 Tax=unclassified Streptomyces TaxID=2593676 RepID=UPI0036C664BE
MLRLASEVLRDTAKKNGHQTHVEIAEHAGVDRSALSRSMAGRTTPTLATVHRLARAYGVKIDDLVLDAEVPA